MSRRNNRGRGKNNYNKNRGGGGGGRSGGFGGGGNNFNSGGGFRNNKNNNSGGFKNNFQKSAQDVLDKTLPLDTDYAAAGILPYRAEGGKIYVLVSVENRKDKGATTGGVRCLLTVLVCALTSLQGPNAKPKDYVCILGGPKDQSGSDANFIVTAMRHFHQKSLAVLDESHITGMMEACASNTSEKQVAMYWAKGRYCLLVYPMTHDLDIVERFFEAKKHSNERHVPLGLQWLAVEDLYSHSDAIQIETRKVKLYSLFRSILVECTELAQYLSQLQNLSSPAASPQFSSKKSLFGGTTKSGGLFGGNKTGANRLFGAAIASATASTSSTAINPDFETIAQQFGASFYEAFNNNKQDLVPFFTDQSMFTCVGEPLMGAQAILERLDSMSMNLTPEGVGCQPLPGNGVLMIVNGKISQPAAGFSQVFSLLPAGGSYVVGNMILRDC